MLTSNSTVPIRLKETPHEAIVAATNALLQGGIVALPTDTLYGAACLAQNSTAVHRLYQLKGRRLCKPMSVCLASVNDFHLCCQVSDDPTLKASIASLLPGPVTIVLPRSSNLNPDLNPGTSLVGVRVPNHDWLLNLCQELKGAPLALTSANRSTEQSTLTVEEFRDLWPYFDVVIDGGPIFQADTPFDRQGSTVIDLSHMGKFKILRSGCALETTCKILERHGLTSSL